MIWQHLRNKILLRENPTIIEIGVHWAHDTRRIMNLCKGKPTYVGFEPDPRNISVIKKAILPYKLTLVESAVGNINSEVDFYLSDGTHAKSGNKMTGANSIRKPTEALKKRHGWIEWGREIKVPCIRLDDYIKGVYPTIDFLWADMQGAEYDMILGGKETLKRTRYAFLEYSDVPLYEGQKLLNDYMQLLNSFGKWEIVQKYQIDVLIRNCEMTA